MRNRVLLTVLLLVALVAPASPAAAAPTTAERQLTWLIEVSHRVPAPEAELREHLTGEFLAGIGGPEQFNTTLGQFGPLTLREVLDTGPTTIRALAGDLLIFLGVDETGLVNTVQITPYLPAPTSWSELDSRLRTLAPRTSFTASVIDGDDCRPVHQVGQDTVHPLGSAVKLYILGALGEHIAAGRATWDTELAIREDWKSMPSGVLQDEPAGTRLPLRTYADLMISISDNTATDHLIHYLGRAAVSRQLDTFGNSVPALNKPLITTREFFALKGFHYPTLADTYLSLPKKLRAAMLPAIDAVPRDRIEGWPEPRNIDEIEYFGTPADMCRALAGLWRQHTRPGQAPVDTALSIQDGGLGLARNRFPTVWFKGGSEPGVLTMNHLAATADGRVVMTSVMLADPDAEIDPALTFEVLALARGGLRLAAG